MSVSSSKIENHRDGVNNNKSPDGAQKNAAQQDIKKTKTIQHLLSDWRTAYTKSKKVILLDLSFRTYSLAQYIFRKQLLER